MTKTMFFIVILLCLMFSTLSAESFDDYINQQEQENKQNSQEFEIYKKEISVEFELYNKIANEEYENYVKELEQYWDEPEISDNKKWVEYLPDLKTKKVVDFEKGEIKIDIISEKKDVDNKQKFNNILEDLLLEDKKTAFERDKIAQNIEKKVIQKIKNFKTDNVEKKRILIPIVMPQLAEKDIPDSKQIKKIVFDLIEKGTLDNKPSKIQNNVILSLKIQLPPKAILNKAKGYKNSVEKYTNKNKISADLAFAVIHTESYFNPMAKSQVPAYGLMQIVPQTAGKDVTNFLYGKPSILAPSYLYNDENNINVGTTYFGLVFNGYLKNIKNDESRLYCAIAAYNTGVGNIAKTFTGNTKINIAVDIINKMTAEEVYETLINKLPYEETRKYLKMVVDRKNMYKNL